jgi:hypothetical protein
MTPCEPLFLRGSRVVDAAASTELAVLRVGDGGVGGAGSDVRDDVAIALRDGSYGGGRSKSSSTGMVCCWLPRLGKSGTSGTEVLGSRAPIV